MKRLVVIGGGFAGLTVARALAGEFQVTLVDSKPFFEFTPGILRTLVEPGHMTRIQRPFDSFLSGVHFVQGKVTALSPSFVVCGSQKIPYDFCVIATGSEYKAPLKEHTVVLASRAHHLHAFHEHMVKAKSLVVAGGGLAGVELMGELATHYPEKELHMIHPHARLLSTHTPASARYAEHFLRKRGVIFHFNERLTSVTGTKAYLSSGKILSADLVCYCTGIVPLTSFVPPSWKTKRGHVITNSFLQVPRFPHIFVAGDANSIAEEKTAQHAERQAKVVIDNLRALEKNTKLRAYHHRVSPVLISLGKYDGILEYRKLVIRGWLPAFLKWFVERKEMWKLR